MSRVVRINFNDGSSKNLELSKAVCINDEIKTLIELEKLKDCSYRLIFSKSLIDDFSKVKNIEIIRKDLDYSVKCSKNIG